MSTKHLEIAPTEALDRIFTVIREEAAANPTFARRLLDAAGVPVLFQGPDASIAVDPVLVAARHDYPAFREMFLTFPEADLKKMITAFGLGTAEDVRRVSTKPKKLGFIDILWDGACRKVGRSSE
jgi:hypothetical protein